MFKMMKKHKMLFAVCILTSILFAAVAVGAAFVLENIMNAVTRQDWALFRTMIWVVVMYVAAVAAIYTLDSLCKKKLVIRVVQDMRAGVYEGILSRDVEHYHAVNTADYISALTNDVKTVEENALVPFLQSIQYIMIFLMSAGVLVWYSPLIAGLMFVCLVAMYIVPSALGKPISRRQEALSGSLSQFTAGVKDQFSGYEVIRSFQLEGRSKKAFARQNSEVSGRRYAVERLLAYSEGISQVLGMGTQLLVMLFSAWLVLRGEMTAGVLLAILNLSGTFVQPVAVVMQNIPKMQGTKGVIERIETLAAPQDPAFCGTCVPRFEQSIQFENLSFSYSPERPVLKKLNAGIEKNKKYALVGGSGCGKTTLIRLLCAGYSGYSGGIYVDGTELHEVDIKKLLPMISVIHQNVYMFDESIGENISLRRDYSEDKWARALSVSGVDRFLEGTADGLNTPVGEGGASLSGGQRQRVAVARALIEGKPILILDEGTSAVDARTAYEIEAALLAAPDITMVTITHNLNPVLLRQYDGILFMEEGRIAEMGTYDELMRCGGFAEYTQLKEKEAV